MIVKGCVRRILVCSWKDFLLERGFYGPNLPYSSDKNVILIFEMILNGTTFGKIVWRSKAQFRKYYYNVNT